jgi:phosphoribosylamine--glycine ligase
MEKVSILIVSYGARAAAIIDALTRSQNYIVELYVADKQRNPFNIKKAFKHVVIPDLNIEKICKFVEANKDKIDFGIVGPEKPIINGVRDLIETRTKVPIICPKKEFAIEGSKVAQRLLFQKTVPDMNPRFKIFDPNDFKSISEVKSSVYTWLDELENKAVVKPDKPAAGKGVGVWGDHFTSREQLFEHFLSNFHFGKVIIEEKVEGEESSFQVLCDGKHLVPLPETRDYKRAFNDDQGPNTGGMGSYKDVKDVLPFMRSADRTKEIEIVTKIFEKLKMKDDDALRGIPFYLAFMHTGKNLKILENNSRPGDPEIQNILPIIKNDFVDICFKILERNLTQIDFEKLATVVTYKVPPNYGGYMTVFPSLVNKNKIDTPVKLGKACKLASERNEEIRIYPASMELRDDNIYALKSRAICVVGIGEEIASARHLSLEGIKAIKGGALWSRTDVASKAHIDKSIKHLESLRRL